MAIDLENFIIPPYYSDINKNSIITNRNISGKDARNFALNSNYLVANGNYQVCNCMFDLPIDDSNKTYYTRLTFFKNPNITERMVIIDMDTTAKGISTLSASFVGTFYNMNYGNTIASSYATNARGVKLIGPISENPNGLNITPGQIDDVTLEILFTTNNYTGSSAADPITIKSLTVFDLPPRYRNPTDSTTGGVGMLDQIAVDVNSCSDNKPIFTSPGTKQNSSIAGIVRNIDQYSSSLSYKNIYAELYPYIDSAGIKQGGYPIRSYPTGPSTGSGFAAGTKAMVFATQTDVDQTEKECWVYAFAVHQDTGSPVGTTGSFHISSSTGDTLTLTFNPPTANGMWASGSISLPTEQVLSASYGGMPYYLNNLSGTISMYSSITSGSSDASNYRTLYVSTIQIFEKV